MAILGMVTHPANMVMTIVPRTMAAFAGFDRIQDFLLRPSLHDCRMIHQAGGMMQLSQLIPTGQKTLSTCALQVRQLVLGHGGSILDDISFEAAIGSLTIISGPTGSGKTTLLRAILGEATPIRGSISIATTHIGYCSQHPWLPSGSIKAIIFGPANISRLTDKDLNSWYRTVVRTCCLEHDFASLSNGDKTEIGSRGLNLSGGQRQRVVSVLMLVY